MLQFCDVTLALRSSGGDNQKISAPLPFNDREVELSIALLRSLGLGFKNRGLNLFERLLKSAFDQ